MPKQGDIIWINFDPVVGREQSGYRPALVISRTDFNRMREMSIICPITSKHRDIAMRVQLDDRTETFGDVLCEQPRIVDLRIRPFKISEQLPNDLLKRVVNIAMSITRVDIATAATPLTTDN